MKKIMLSMVTCLLLTTGIDAQRKELAITFSGLNNFGFSYRFGEEKAVWRINSAFGIFNNETNTYDSLEQSFANTTMRIALGREWRKPVNEKLTFRFGVDINGGYRLNASETKDMRRNLNSYNRTSEERVYTTGANLVLGFNYQLSPNFIAGVEFLPGATYFFGSGKEQRGTLPTDEYDTRGFNGNINLNSVLLSFVYVIR